MFYCDSSAIVKLFDEEDESASLRAFLDRQMTAASLLARVEVIRHVRRQPRGLEVEARRTLRRFDLVPMTPRIMVRAAALQPTGLRTLDAIHVATALSIRAELEALVTYDRRMIEAATYHGLPVASPGMATA